MSDDSTENEQLPPLPPLWRRVIDVFVSPGKLFESLAANPRWLGAVIVGGIFITLSSALIPLDLIESMIRAQMLERGQEMPAGPAQMAKVGKIVGTVMGSVIFLLISLVVGGICTLVFGFILGDRGKFRQYFAATAHAFLIYAIGALAITPLRITARDPQLLLSPGNALQGILPDGYLLNVISLLDVFGIWAYLVLAIAVTRIDSKRGFGSAFAFLLVVAVGFAMFGAIFR